MEDAKWPQIAVMGAGAVGCYYGGMLARAGASVTLIGRLHHVEAINQSGLRLETAHFQQTLPLTASTEASAVRDAKIVLLCVKSPDTEEAARALMPYLDGEAVVLSLQNGVDNVERIHTAIGIEAIPAVVYVGAEMTAPGCVKHTARGDLIIGDLIRRVANGPIRQALLEQVARLFERAGVPCRVSENVEGELWVKLVINCSYNALSAVSRQRYGRIVGNPHTRNTIRQLVEEAVAVAEAAGVQMTQSNMVEAAWKLGEVMSGTLSSTAQDIGRGKRTEIDSLNGYVARRGAELGVPTPVNQTLHALVKLIETSTSETASP
jgi:2-dehydropantoate 2-reductase